MPPIPPPPVDGTLINEVILVDHLRRERPVAYESTSLPGHLVHLIIHGRVHQESGGRTYILGPGDAVWYHEDEPVSGKVLQAPWDFLTVNFIADSLSPPPFEMRVVPTGKNALRAFTRLLSAWRDVSVGAALRQLRVASRLLTLLEHLLPRESQSFVINPAARLWWDIESQLRKDLRQPIDLRHIQKLTSRSMRTIARSCYEASGMPPMQRVKQMRMSMGRGLVLHSALRFTEIAARIGYPRVQEFSRDYHSYFGLTPSADRNLGPDYQRPRANRRATSDRA